MEAVLLVIHLIVASGIIILVLIQPSEAGGFLGNSGTMSNLMAPRRSADILTRLTTIFAAIFFATSLLLAIVAQNKPERQSIIDLVKGDAKPGVEKSADPATATDPAVEDKIEKKTEPTKPETPKAPISK